MPRSEQCCAHLLSGGGRHLRLKVTEQGDGLVRQHPNLQVAAEITATRQARPAPVSCRCCAAWDSSRLTSRTSARQASTSVPDPACADRLGCEMLHRRMD